MTDGVPPPYRLDGLVAVITGAAQGLGLGMAGELARQGARVVIADLQEEKAAEAAASLKREQLEVRAVGLDVTDSTAVDRCFAQLATAEGRLDVLVNNAGLGQNVCYTVALSDEDWRRVLDVNLNGTFYAARAAGRIMEQQESGAIVNVASINGETPAALVAAYNVAKAGVISLTRTLALELAPYGVRVNAVSPGPVYTDFNREVMQQRSASLGITEEEMIDRVEKAIPLGRWGEPADIARAVAFLAGPAAGWITGTILRVSGGLEGVAAAPPRRA